MVLQHVGQLAAAAQKLHHAHHKERTPEEQEAAHQHRHRPQGFGVDPEAAPRLLQGLVLVWRPGSGSADQADLLVVAARYLQDVQVDVNEHREHGEEDNAEDDHEHLPDDGEKGAEPVIAVHPQRRHHDCRAQRVLAGVTSKQQRTEIPFSPGKSPVIREPTQRTSSEAAAVAFPDS